jgi:WD40 repeat protein/flagellar biosynthesis GTPase FlhF
MSVAVTAPPSPYKGLAPFEDSDADALLFFGRELESEVIAANLIASRITVLYGPSGVGKSSVLRAGVAHRLRKERDAQVIVFANWTGDPVAGLIEAAGGSGGSLADALADAADRAGGDLYLILDQFEECFLYHKNGGQFAQQLASVLRRGGLRVNVLIGMREDALARLDTLKASIPNLLANRLRLERLDRQAAGAAITGPLERYNEFVASDARIEIEPELELAVLDQVTAGRVELGGAGRGVSLAARDENRIEAPYLQLVLTRLWEVERGRGSRLLRLATLAELGGAEHIVEAHLEEAMAALSPREKGAAAAMYHFLVTPSGTKIAHGIGDLAGYAAVPEDEAAGVLQRLTAERIVRASSENGPSTTRYEIFHDVLAAAVVAWRTRFEAERALEEERLQHRRRQRRLLLIGIAALVAMAVMAAIAVYALDQRAAAQHQAQVAQEQQSKAEASAAAEKKSAAREKAAKKTAQANAKKAKQSEQKYRQAAAESQAQEERANDAAASERSAKQQAQQSAAVAENETRHARAATQRAERATHRETLAKAAAVRQRNVNRAERLAAEASASLAVDAEKSVQQSLSALRAFRIAKIRHPAASVEDTLREGILRLRVRAVLRLQKKGSVQVARFSPDDSLVFVGGVGGAALFDRSRGFRARALLPRTDILDAAFSPDGTLVAGAGGRNDRIAHVWDVRTGAQVLALEHQGAVNSVAFSPNGQLIATGSADGTARLWSVAGGLLLASFQHETGARGKAVQYVAFSPDGTRLLTVGGNKFARVFDVARHAELFALNNVGVVNAARFSHDGNLIATAGATEAVRIWSAKTGDPVDVLNLTGRVADLAFSPNDKLLATAGSNDTIARVWNFAQQTWVAHITQHRSGVESVTFTPDSGSVITAGRDGRAIISGTAAGFEQASLAGHTRPLEGAGVSHDGSLIATWSQDGTARIWDARVGTVARDVGKHDLPSATRSGPIVAFSPNGRTMLSAGADGTARLWGPATQLHVLEHGAAVNSAGFSGNGARVITGGADGRARVWRVADGQLVAELPHGAVVTGARLTPNGRSAVTAGRDGVVRVWNVATRATVRRYDLGGSINDLELSRNGRFAVAASSNKLAAVYGVAARSEVLLKGHTDEVVAAAFSPDGTRVATASADSTARIWNSRTGKSVELVGHSAGLTALAFNNDGSLLATTGTDTDIRVWNGRSGAEVAVLRGHSGVVNDVTFSADGRWIASAGPLSAGIWQVRKRGAWPDTPLYFVDGDAARTPRLDHVAFSPKGWRLLTGWRLGNVRVFDCAVCGGLKELQAIAKSRLKQIVRRSPSSSARRIRPAASR